MNARMHGHPAEPFITDRRRAATEKAAVDLAVHRVRQEFVTAESSLQIASSRSSVDSSRAAAAADPLRHRVFSSTPPISFDSSDNVHYKSD